MSLQQHFVRSGNRLFRHRSYLPLVAVAIGMAQMADFGYPDGSHDADLGWEAVCFAVGLLGLAIRVYVAGHVPQGTSGRNTRCQIATELNTTGLYSVVRHPLYVGNFLMWLGIGLFVRHWWLILVMTLGFWLYYERIMFAEEDWLRRCYGERFVQWAERTPAVLPNPRLWQPPALPFSIRSALRKEYSGLFALVSLFAGLEVGGAWMVTGRLLLDPVGVAAFGVALVAYLLLRYLKRHTRILDVEGR